MFDGMSEVGRRAGSKKWGIRVVSDEVSPNKAPWGDRIKRIRGVIRGVERERDYRIRYTAPCRLWASHKSKRITSHKMRRIRYMDAWRPGSARSPPCGRRREEGGGIYMKVYNRNEMSGVWACGAEWGGRGLRRRARHSFRPVGPSPAKKSCTFV